jgi:inosine-uridine nucleoside N-ribohydrolase
MLVPSNSADYNVSARKILTQAPLICQGYDHSNSSVSKASEAQQLIFTMIHIPGEVTLLCLGPLTNLALAIRLDPSFLTKVKQLVVMGGSVEGEFTGAAAAHPSTTKDHSLQLS